MTVMQIDLFAPSAETRRLIDGLTCLRDAVPEALQAVLHLTHWYPREDRGVGMSGGWAYSIRRRGLHVDPLEIWGRAGYSERAPADLVTWAELAELLGDDPRRADLIAWSESLVEPAWQERLRPHELWPNPGNWHPDYIRLDHERPGWDQRLAAWTTLQAICTDAIIRLHPAAGAR